MPSSDAKEAAIGEIADNVAQVGLAAVLVAVCLAVGVGLAYLVWEAGTEEGDGDVVLGIRQLNELATVEYTTHVVATVEENPRILRLLPSPDFLTGEQVIVVAEGDVEAGIDLGELGEDDIRVAGETVFVALPDARVLGTSLNEEGTRLYDRGLLRIRGNDELIDAAREDAEDSVLEIARENGILEKAQDNAEDSTRGLVTSLGYERVVFE
jgi:hypothetical protein